jgi:hypothetical protein
MVFIKHRRWIMFMVVLLALMLFNLPTSPINGLVVYSDEVQFDWIGQASYAFIDDNKDFTSPVIVNKKAKIKLKPGKYYWRVSGFGIVNNFEVESLLEVNKKIDDFGVYVENSGSVDSKINLNNENKLTGSFVLHVGERKRLESLYEKEGEIISSFFG